MTLSSMLYKLILGPLTLLFDLIFSVGYRYVTTNIALLVALLSLSINLLVLPLYRRADALQEEERAQSARLQPGVRQIKKVFKGNERFMILQTYYRQNGYKPWYALKGSISLLLEIPFFIAAYNYLSGFRVLQGVAYGPIRDLGAPDGLLHIAGHAINLLPLLMTGINLVSGAIYTKGMPVRSKVQMYGMALIFLVLLYDSPSVLVYYWTLNNIFSLVKNIFYRLRHPKKVIAWLASVSGLALLAFTLTRFGGMSAARKCLMLTVCLALQLPLAAGRLMGRRPHAPAAPTTRGDSVLFTVCCLFLTLLLGALIPLDVIRSSPQEFIDITNYHSSLNYVASSLLLAAGVFLLWFTIYYRLLGSGARRGFGFVTAALCGICVIDYTCFGGSYGTMSAELAYETGLVITKRQYLINGLALLAVTGVIWAAWRLRRSLLRVVAAAGCIALLGMSLMDVNAIQSANADLLSDMKADAEAQAESLEVSFPLDQSGKNVVVVMLDRAIGRFLPYILEEKPELKQRLAGFTFYPNTLSYGSHTNIAAPALFGGYEYTPDAINARDGEPLRDKHDEALCMLPVLFRENGYDVTVCDPPYAGYGEVPDLSIYDQWPGINACLTMTSKAIDNNSLLESNEAVRHRDFFCYSVFRAAPLVFHKLLYNSGRYGEINTVWTQMMQGMYRAQGLNYAFMKDYGALSMLPGYTRIRDEGKNTFLMLDNEAPHAPVLLQMPDYTPAMRVDNTAYESRPIVRTDRDGSAIELATRRQLQHYHINMATILKLADWFDYMRENGVYDNTRIIVVSDHGFMLDGLFDMELSASEDMMFYCPLLMVKDFGAGAFSVDERFMTNADTPLLAVDGLVDPVNPFTGNALSDAQKYAPEQRVANVTNFKPITNNGNTFKTLYWFVNRDAPNDLSAWRRADEGTTTRID